MQTLGNGPDVLRFLRAAWSLFDKTRVVECSIGSVGTVRLRLQMEALADSRLLCEGATTDLEEARPMITKMGQTAIRLATVCSADARFAQVAVLYGTTFMVERLLWRLQAITGEGSILLDPFEDLVRVLKPHLSKLFHHHHIALAGGA
mmetsp:Transcript_60990/g.124438  ORF Transcript_60990/g.124438 Transcript_60990/m.124438 type:complete len:148 (-) Transcript_60990:99-542(-)